MQRLFCKNNDFALLKSFINSSNKNVSKDQIITSRLSTHNHMLKINNNSISTTTTVSRNFRAPYCNITNNNNSLKFNYTLHNSNTNNRIYNNKLNNGSLSVFINRSFSSSATLLKNRSYPSKNKKNTKSKHQLEYEESRKQKKLQAEAEKAQQEKQQEEDQKRKMKAVSDGIKRDFNFNSEHGSEQSPLPSLLARGPDILLILTVISGAYFVYSNFFTKTELISTSKVLENEKSSTSSKALKLGDDGSDSMIGSESACGSNAKEEESKEEDSSYITTQEEERSTDSLDSVTTNQQDSFKVVISKSFYRVSNICVISFYMIRRVIWMYILVTPILLLFPIAYLQRKAFPKVKNAPPEKTPDNFLILPHEDGIILADWWWTIALFCIELSGPTFIKFGQWASTRRDIFNEQFCEHFSVLHTRRRPHAFSYTIADIQRAFSIDQLEDLFEEFNPEPVGSGCVAQVYKAKIKSEFNDKDNPIWVAVKVLHPRVRQHIESDLQLMLAAAKVLSKLPGVEWLGLVDTVEQFSLSMRMQLDLRIEAQNLILFQENFKRDKTINFPVPVNGYISENVLIESFEEGTCISEYIKLQSSEKEIAKKLANLGFQSFLKMVLLHNFVHADLHPGNILVNINEGQEPTLTYLDAGISVKLSEEDQRNFAELLNGIVHNNGEYVGRIMVERARTHKCSDIDAFSQEIGKLVARVHESKLLLSKVKFGDILAEVFNQIREHQVRIETNFANLMLALVVMEGLGRSLDPELDILKACIPILLKAKAKGTIFEER